LVNDGYVADIWGTSYAVIYVTNQYNRRGNNGAGLSINFKTRLLPKQNLYVHFAIFICQLFMVMCAYSKQDVAKNAIAVRTSSSAVYSQVMPTCNLHKVITC